MLEAHEILLEDIMNAVEQEPPSRETKEIRRIVKTITEALLKEENEDE